MVWLKMPAGLPSELRSRSAGLSFMSTTSTSTLVSHSGLAGQPGTLTTGTLMPAFLRYCCTPMASVTLGLAPIQPPLTAQEPSATTALAFFAASIRCSVPGLPATRRALPPHFS